MPAGRHPSEPPPAGPGPRSGPRALLTGLPAFTVVAAGQFFSILGTSMTGVALLIWVWQRTGSATALALIGFLGFGPMVLFSPLAGALVDRWNRKLVMMLSDLAAGVATIGLLTLYLLGHLQVWHLFVAAFFTGLFAAFQFPAFSAAVTLMIPKEHYSRASAMIGLAQSVAGVFAPIAAGALIGVIGLGGIMAIDLVTLSLALGALLLVRVPQPQVSSAGVEARGSLLKEAAYGFRYILARPSLLGLQLVFFAGNFLSSLTGTLAAPLVLARTANNALVLGTVQSVGAAGAVLGGLVLSAWRGPRRKIHGVLLGWAGTFLIGEILMGLARGLGGWAIAVFAGALAGSLINVSNQAIWQRKVPPDVQGRVFSVRLLIAQVSGPMAMLVAGPLADRVLEPGMRAGGELAKVFGGLVGTGPGAGISLLFVIAGVLGTCVALGVYLIRPVRDVETIIPDFDEAKAAEAA
jgi:DHA3 family macrolide efflux protein-like MFS transporter